MNVRRLVAAVTDLIHRTEALERENARYRAAIEAAVAELPDSSARRDLQAALEAR